jgi:hypothetical protein
LLFFGAGSFVFHFLSKIGKINIYGTIILFVALYGCEIWSLTLMEEPEVRVFENRVTRKIFGPKRAKVNCSGEGYITRILMICSTYVGEERYIQGFGGEI